jgi:carboxymethylenebutenolidase
LLGRQRGLSVGHPAGLARRANPDAGFYVYDADHGFNCDQRGSYDAPSAKLAMERTLAFFEKNLS